MKAKGKAAIVSIGLLASLAFSCQAQHACSLPLHPNVRINGNDINPERNASSAQDCCALCTAEEQCKAFLFVKGGVCWLKTAASSGVPCGDCVAGALSIPPPSPPSPHPPHPPPPPPPSPGCKSDVDCNGSGACVNDSCTCGHGWTGEHCELIHFGPAYKCDAGGLCLNHTSASSYDKSYTDNFTATWGGEVVRADDGSWHMYAASFGHDAGLGSWLSNSRVIHSMSSAPEGPYVLKDVALGPTSQTGGGGAWDAVTQHNPAAQRDPVTGMYLIYYMGSTTTSNASSAAVFPSSTTTSNASSAAVFPSSPTLESDNDGAADFEGVWGENKCADNPGSKTLCMQRIGLAWSASPNGPWTRSKQPIVPPGAPGAWDDLFTCNPTPHVFPNGSVLLLYKARSNENFGTMSTGVAYADHWSGPYKKIGDKPIDVSGGCEDAGIYQANPVLDGKPSIFHIIFHCGCNYQAAWSVDGINWERTTPSVPFCNVTFSDGSSAQLSTRQRPKWLVDPRTGNPTHLITGSGGPNIHGKQTFTMVQELL